MAGSLESTFAIPKSWFYDLNTYDTADLLGASVGVVAVVLGWNRADTETFASLAAGMGLPAAVGANPLLMVVVVVAAARAFHKARPGGEYTELVDGGFKGAVGSGATMAAVALTTSAGGPAGVALLVGLTAGIVANSATKNVSLTAIGRFIATRAAAMTTDPATERPPTRRRPMGSTEPTATQRIRLTTSDHLDRPVAAADGLPVDRVRAASLPARRVRGSKPPRYHV